MTFVKLIPFPPKATSAAAFVLTALTLAVVQLKVAPPMLLLERFWAGGGWLEILGLSTYAAWIAEKMSRPADSARWRRRIWLVFSAVFFAQLLLGMTGLDQFLMSGRLHPPVPALIVAGPLYRGARFFMPILFGATLLLVGPAWCSHLCYIGAWDQLAAEGRRRPGKLPAWAPKVRVALLVAVVGAALGLGAAGVPAPVAGGIGLAFGVVGVAVMALGSRRAGVMTHCAVYCPIGLLADLAGKLSPFRIRIGEGCDDCGRCTRTCRYDALNRADIENRRPGLTCTLCGDCLAGCVEEQIEYRFAWWQGPRVRAAFVVLVVSLHAVFLGVARI